jgi:Haloacid dehalogenase-like hydrolase
VDQTTPHPAKPTKEVLLSLHRKPRVLKPGSTTNHITPSLSGDPGGNHRTQLHRSFDIASTDAAKSARLFGVEMTVLQDISASAEMGVRHTTEPPAAQEPGSPQNTTQPGTEDDMTRRILLFDFDGTLADTMHELVDALVDTLVDQLGGEERVRRDQVMHVIHLPPREMIQAVADLTGWPPSRIQSMAMTRTARLPTRLFPEVPAVLASLKQSGYVVVISSNNPDETFRDRLVGVGLTDDCDFA